MGVIETGGLSELRHAEAADTVTPHAGEESERMRMTVQHGDQRRGMADGEELVGDIAAHTGLPAPSLLESIPVGVSLTVHFSIDWLDGK